MYFKYILYFIFSKVYVELKKQNKYTLIEKNEWVIPYF